ncbi:13850_t:CDS:1, partial [Dentiscutata heterogama]
TLTLGGVDKSKFTGEITFNPVIPNIGFWLITLVDASVNGKTALTLARPAIIDTGTTLLLIPPDDAAAIHKQIPGYEYDSQDDVYIIPCNTTAVVSLNFGGVEYNIPSRDLTFLPISSTQC